MDAITLETPVSAASPLFGTTLRKKLQDVHKIEWYTLPGWCGSYESA